MACGQRRFKFYLCGARVSLSSRTCQMLTWFPLFESISYCDAWYEYYVLHVSNLNVEILYIVSPDRCEREYSHTMTCFVSISSCKPYSNDNFSVYTFHIYGYMFVYKVCIMMIQTTSMKIFETQKTVFHSKTEAQALGTCVVGLGPWDCFCQIFCAARWLWIFHFTENLSFDTGDFVVLVPCFSGCVKVTQ